MKCPKCKGEGRIIKKEKGTIGYIARLGICDKCHGSGEVEMTKEEWLRSATFEEIAGAIYEWYSQGHIEGKFGKQLSSATRVVEWLKETHDEM